MVESEQMQDGGVQVVDMDLVLGGIVTELVGRTVSESRFCTATGQPHRESVRVVIPAVGPLHARSASEFSTPPDQGVFEQSTGLEIAQQSANRAIDLLGVLGVSTQQVGVLVPLDHGVTVSHLDKSDASFQEPAGQQALSPEVLGDLFVESVQLVCCRGFL